MLDDNNDQNQNADLTASTQTEDPVVSGIPEPAIVTPDSSVTPDDSSSDDDSVTGAPETTDSSDSSDSDRIDITASPTNDDSADTTTPTPDTTTTDSEPTSERAPSLASNSGDLATIKQNALEQLTPLISHLDQPPEEKFKTLMMMVQASDDPGLLQEIYDTAKEITDDKERAQALLDVVNEINYFTQHNKD